MNRNVAIVLAALVVPASAFADEAGQCADNRGTFITGTIIVGPWFAHGSLHQNVELSHTHVTLKSDQDGQQYDIAIDNVFASGYDNTNDNVPFPLNSISVGTRLELCGKLYTHHDGLDWVHTDCGTPPTPHSPEGWVKIIDAAGLVGSNLEASTEYCKIFN